MSGTDKGGRESNETLGKVIEWKHNKLPRPMEILSIETKIYEPDEIAIKLEKCREYRMVRESWEEIYKESKEELAQIQLAEGLDGLRHNNIVFRCREVQGRVSYVTEKMMRGMEMEGLSKEAIMRVLNFARKTSDSYFVKEIGTE